ncbi:ATP-grasp peptide maturase system methyltransferase [Tenggerimyces flavus]|uniref:Protein-L-isoaspartate O-methyltransferase n=1 Tax=Tenggerimyces flavus TaxID=1708749 RepID=A0ABV7Y6A6_9ACTN|nr:ATP-grasp peptide maturase system methyltransferase [Tenggerimyces flavus]MBM7785075.1 protein-L-isoaspartate(D-aspartate) O-methyltransferase [Tenggerimyces flavus]
MNEDHNSVNVGRDPARQRLRTELADLLIESGDLRSQAWRQALLATPRDAFLPRFFMPHSETGELVLVTTSDPEWIGVVYSNEPLVTQFDGDPGATHGVPTSSSTAPGLMLRMLEALELDDGMRTLEIGTGTGYNAALLCHRVGDKNVTTIDVDPAIVETARGRLNVLGLQPTVIAGDGANGWSANAPFDRIIATCAVRHIPSEWIAQTAIGGRILTTIETSLHGYALVLLVPDGRGSASGSFLRDAASFMPMRSHASPAFAQLRGRAAQTTTRRRSGLRPLDLDSDAARFAIGLALPDVSAFSITTEGGAGIYLGHHLDGSWTQVTDTGSRINVEYGGPQDLWAVAEDTHARWVRHREPEPSQFSLSVDAEGTQTVHLHTAQGPNTWTSFDAKR